MIPFVFFIILFSGFVLLCSRKSILNYRCQILGILFLGMYGAFSVLGYDFFLPKNKLFMFDLSGMFVFIIMTMLMSGFVISIFISIDFLKNSLIQTAEDINSRNIRYFFCQSFMLLSIIWTIWLILLFPGVFDIDSFYLWESAGNQKFNNYFSAFLIWILAVFYKIVPNPFLPILFQMLVAACLFSLWATEFYRQKISKNVIFITLGLFALYPPVAFFIISLVRDMPYSIVVIGLTYFIYQIIFRSRYDKIFILILGLLTPLAYFFRQNGIIVVIGIIFFISLYPSTRRKILYFFLGLIISYSSYQTIWILTKTGPDKSKNFPSLVVIPISNSYIYHLELRSPLAVNLVEKSGGAVNWVNKPDDPYPISSFHNVPIFALNAANKQWNSVIYHEMSKKDIILTYFSLWRYDFNLSLRTRINLIANFWSINIPDCAVLLYTVSTLNRIKGHDTYSMHINFRRPNFLNHIHGFLQSEPTLYFIGGGFYTFLLLIVILYIYFYQDRRKLWLLLPWCCNFLSLFIASTAVQYRYIWIGFPILIIMLGMVFIHNKNKSKEITWYRY